MRVFSLCRLKAELRTMRVPGCAQVEPFVAKQRAGGTPALPGSFFVAVFCERRWDQWRRSQTAATVQKQTVNGKNLAL